jgi:hypothetical protein
MKEGRMPSTTYTAPPFCPDLSHSGRLDALGVEGRLRAYERGELTRTDLSIWAARFPDEPPLVNGELAWIALKLVDLD